jgi:hypothetical protein
MAEEYKINVKFVPDTSSLKSAIGNLGNIGVGGMASGATGGGLGMGKGIGGALKGMSGMLGGILRAILPVAGLLMVIGHGLKPLITGISILLRPIRDILMIGLLPLLYIMRPIGIFFRTLMKPYYQKAMALMRTGAMLQNSGDIEAAMESYALGGLQLMTGFVVASATGMVAAFNTLMGVTDPVAKAIETVSGFTKDWTEALDLASVGIINTAHAAGTIDTAQWEKLTSVFLAAGSEETKAAITTYKDSISGLADWFEQNSSGFAESVGAFIQGLRNEGMSGAEIDRQLIRSLVVADVNRQTSEKYGDKPSYNFMDTLKIGGVGAVGGFTSTGNLGGAVVGGLSMIAMDIFAQLKEIETYEEDTLEYKKSIWDDTVTAVMERLGKESPVVADILAGIKVSEIAFFDAYGVEGKIPTSIGVSNAALTEFNTSWQAAHGLEDLNLTVNIHTNYTSSGRSSRR